jgi:glycosyltransferase involved in cell wall biosynthesis
MKVLLPTHQIGAAGIGTVIEGLAAWLPEALADDDELLLVGECPPDGRAQANVRCIRSPQMARTRFGRLVHEQIGIPRAARDVDLVHLPNPHAVLFSSAPFVLTIHDVFFLDRPEWYPPSFVAFKRAMLSRVMARRPRVILCVSHFSRQKLLEHHPERAEDTFVIHPGVSPTRQERTGDGESYFLTLATFEPRKNHLGLLEALRLARARGLRLRWKVAGIEGYGSRDILATLRREEGVDVLGRVSVPERDRLYEGARFFAFPSHAEGFGFPPLEAMVRGVPTICSLGSAMDETVGDAALRVPSHDVEGWADALLRLADDAAERRRLQEIGRARANEFNWRRTADEYVRWYREALGLPAEPPERELAQTVTGS